MSEVKWIKITTDMFDNRKIKHLRKLPDGNNIVLIWVMLLTMAGRCNANGMIFLTENIPYTPKMLADELGFDESVVALSLQALQMLNMIVTDGEFFSIAGWEEYQSADKLEKIREQNRLRKAAQREREQLLLPMSRDSHVTVTQCHATDIEEDKEEDKDIDVISTTTENTNYKQIVDMYHEICKSLPRVRSISDARKKAIRARLKSYTIDDFKTVFENAEASSFLRGDNGRDWVATFDWLLKDSKFPRVLEGYYSDKPKSGKEPVKGWGTAKTEREQTTVNDNAMAQLQRAFALVNGTEEK